VTELLYRLVEYEQSGQDNEGATRTVLVGLLTRSDLLMALARSLGAFEPEYGIVNRNASR